MKQILSILMMLLVLLLGGCSSDDVCQDNPGKRSVIGFDNGMVDNAVATRAGVTPLAIHHETMGVWGWEAPGDDSEHILFSNQKVSYDDEAGEWTYSPLKYWVDDAQYRFYAYAPYCPNASINAEDGKISIPDIVLTGANIQEPATTTLKDNFSGCADTDWMITRTGQFVPGTYRYKVAFVMNHILAKFVVAVGLGETIAADSCVTKVSVDDMTISDFASRGSFAQKFDHTPMTELCDTVPQMGNEEWTLDSGAPRYSLALKEGCEVTEVSKYLFETLALPQVLKDDAEVLITYSFTYSDGKVERYLYSLPLRDAFTQFDSGSCYQLRFTINPRCITFDAGVLDWKEQVEC